MEIQSHFQTLLKTVSACACCDSTAWKLILSKGQFPGKDQPVWYLAWSWAKQVFMFYLVWSFSKVMAPLLLKPHNTSLSQSCACWSHLCSSPQESRLLTEGKAKASSAQIVSKMQAHWKQSGLLMKYVFTELECGWSPVPYQQLLGWRFHSLCWMRGWAEPCCRAGDSAAILAVMCGFQTESILRDNGAM